MHGAVAPAVSPARHPTAPSTGTPEPLGLVLLNLGGPDSLEAVEPYLRNLFADPDVIQLPPVVRWFQPLLARVAAQRRAPLSREAYRQIGGRSPIAEESAAQAAAVATELARRGLRVRGTVAMACWRPFSPQAVAELDGLGIRRAVAVPLFPHHSRATTGSSLAALQRAITRARSPLQLACVDHYPDAPGYLLAVSERIEAALMALPSAERGRAPVLFSAHGLPESYIRRGDAYLDDVRLTVAEVTRRLGLGARARLCFQSRLGPGRWLTPTTQDALSDVAAEGHRAVVVVPIAFTGEHLETLQELDIMYRQHAARAGLVHFSRARTVGCHPAFVNALAELAEGAARARGWV